MARFVLNDEKKVNSYGFRVLNAGIDFSRFNANPVMLNQHENSTSSVIGRWKDLQIADGKLTAESEFDAEDAEIKTLAGKVERGFIKGASMGIAFDPKNMKRGKDGVFELTKCTLFEASICAIPSNENALSLFAQDGHKLTPKEISLQLSNFKKFTPMGLLPTLIELLRLEENATEEDVVNEVQSMIESKDQETQKKVEQMLTLAVNDYNLDRQELDFWREAALKDFDKVQTMLLAPNKKRIYLSKLVKNAGGNMIDKASWTLDDWRKNEPKELERNPELFKKLYEQENRKPLKH